MSIIIGFTNIEELAQHLNVSTDTAYYYVRSGKVTITTFYVHNKKENIEDSSVSLKELRDKYELSTTGVNKVLTGQRGLHKGFKIWREDDYLEFSKNIFEYQKQ